MVTIAEAATVSKTTGKIKIYGPSPPKKEAKEKNERSREILGHKKSIFKR